MPRIWSRTCIRPGSWIRDATIWPPSPIRPPLSSPPRCTTRITDWPPARISSGFRISYSFKMRRTVLYVFLVHNSCSCSCTASMDEGRFFFVILLLVGVLRMGGFVAATICWKALIKRVMNSWIVNFRFRPLISDTVNYPHHFKYTGTILWSRNLVTILRGTDLIIFSYIHNDE